MTSNWTVTIIDYYLIGHILPLQSLLPLGIPVARLDEQNSSCFLITALPSSTWKRLYQKAFEIYGITLE